MTIIIISVVSFATLFVLYAIGIIFANKHKDSKNNIQKEEHKKENTKKVYKASPDVVNTRLFYACEEGDLDLAKDLIEVQKADVNKKNSIGNTALFEACKSNNLDLVKYLIEERNVDYNVKNRFGETILFVACANGNLELNKYLIEKVKIDYNVKNVYGETALFASCRHGKLDLMKFLIEDKKMDINFENSFGKNLFNISTIETGEYIRQKLNIQKNETSSKMLN